MRLVWSRVTAGSAVRKSGLAKFSLMNPPGQRDAGWSSRLAELKAGLVDEGSESLGSKDSTLVT